MLQMAGAGSYIVVAKSQGELSVMYGYSWTALSQEVPNPQTRSSLVIEIP